MNAALEHGVVPGGSLMMLEQLVHEIYLPMLTASTAAPAAAEPPAAATTSAEASSEFVGNLQKFGSQISHAIQQVGVTPSPPPHPHHPHHRRPPSPSLSPPPPSPPPGFRRLPADHASARHR